VGEGCRQEKGGEQFQDHGKRKEERGAVV
jgi:hypothetical protein